MFADPPYVHVYHASRMKSRQGSFTPRSNSRISSPRAEAVISEQPQGGASTLSDHSSSDQLVLLEAKTILLYELATRVGWPMLGVHRTAGSLWEPVMREVLSQANWSLGRSKQPLIQGFDKHYSAIIMLAEQLTVLPYTKGVGTLVSFSTCT